LSDASTMVVLPEDMTLPSKVEKVKNGVPHWLEFIPVDITDRDSYAEDPAAHCNKAHLIFYLNSRHWNESKEKTKTIYSNKNASGNAQRKTLPSKRYNRIAFFADCLKAGQVCAKILEAHSDSLSFFENMRDGGYGIGWCYVLEEYVEPRHDDTTLETTGNRSKLTVSLYLL